MKLHWMRQLVLFRMAVQGLAIQQVRHDGIFQPDHVLRVSEEVTSIACRSKQVAVVNGLLSKLILFSFRSID